MNKKLIALVALIMSAHSTMPWYGRGGWGYRYSPYDYGYYNGLDLLAGAATTAAIVGSRPKSDAEVDYQREKDEKRETKRKINDKKRDKAKKEKSLRSGKLNAQEKNRIEKQVQQLDTQIDTLENDV